MLDRYKIELKKMMVADIQKLSKKLGHTPSVREINESGVLSCSMIFNYFGTLTKFQKEAGLTPTSQGPAGDGLTREERIAGIQKLAKHLGHTPSAQEIIEAGICSRGSISKYFGTLSKFQKAAGLEPSRQGNYTGPRFTKEECIVAIQKLAKKLGHTPSAQEFTEAGICSFGSVCNHFGSLGNFQKKAGLTPSLRGNFTRSNFTKEECIAGIQKLAKKLGHTPSAQEFIEAGICSIPLVYKYFGTLGNFQKAAGLTPSPRGNPAPVGGKIVTKEECIARIQKLAQKLGYTPTSVECGEANIFSFHTVYNHFKTFGDFQQAAGLAPRTSAHVSKEECMDELKRLTKKLRRLPSGNDLFLYAKYTPNRIFSLVGGVREIAKIKELRRICA